MTPLPPYTAFVAAVDKILADFDDNSPLDFDEDVTSQHFDELRHLRKGISAAYPLPPPAEPEPRVPCRWFCWIGQAFYCCDRCGGPAWEHDGFVALGTDNPFSCDGETGKPWESEAAREACRAKWEPLMIRDRASRR